MYKIVVTNNQEFSKEQRQRLESLGDVTYYDRLPKNAEEYLERVKNADIICSGTAGLKEAYPYLKNVYVTVAFVSVAFVDLEVLRKNNVTISNAPGANRHAVSEWIVFMMLFLLRNFDDSLNRVETYRKKGNLPPITKGLAGNKVIILGKGNIGTRVGEIAKALEMDVDYFQRGHDLIKKVANADVVVDTLGANATTQGLLDRKFFYSMKSGSCFVTITGPKIVDYDAMIEAVDSGRLAGAASDCGSILVGDTEDPIYQRLLKHPKIYVTPHIAYNSEMARKTGANIMIDNVEAWIKDKPQNVLN